MIAIFSTRKDYDGRGPVVASTFRDLSGKIPVLDLPIKKLSALSSQPPAES
jgi:hypothetical protein